MNIIRKIKINSLGMYEFNDSEKELFYFIKENMLNLKQVKLEKYPNYIFYFKDDKCILEQDLNCDWFGVRYLDIWEIFQYKFNYNYKETKQLIKSIIEQAYKLNGVILLAGSFTPILEVELAYKLSMNATPKIIIK